MYNFTGMTRTWLSSLVDPASGFLGLIPLSELPDGAAGVAPNEPRIHIPQFVELVNGATYLVVDLTTSVSEQVRS